MKIKICLNNVKELASLSLLKTNTENMADTLNGKKERESVFGDVAYRCFSNLKYGIVQLDVRTKRNHEVICDFEGSAIVMSFMEKGLTYCSSNQTEGSMHDKQNNVFINNGLVRCRLKEANCFRIVLSCAYVEKLARLYPETMAPLVSAIREKRSCVFEHSHLSTTLEMEQIIKTILNTNQLQPGEEMFIEAKIRELLYMQILQYLKALNKKDFKLERYREQMQTACRYIENNLLQLPSFREIALSAGVCDTTLKIAFKYFYGKTVFGYLNECRMHKACELLKNPSYSISDVAFLVGYKHASHFSMTFKQVYGISPAGYRNKNMKRFA